jgi:hypothetical protein
MNFLSTMFYGVQMDGFVKGIQGAVDNITYKDGMFAGDNLFTFGRNLGFLEDEKFAKAWRANSGNPQEESLVWRIAVLAWAAKSVIGRKIPGDFVECACYKGTTARVICEYTDFVSIPDRQYYLYDLFVHDQSMIHHGFPEHGPQLYQQVKAKFADHPNVHVTQGHVPEVLAEISPEQIAFMNLDLNNAPAEIDALEVLFDRISPGGIMVLDDYGWRGYRAQKLAEDPWLAARGYQVLELPTGQGLLFK